MLKLVLKRELVFERTGAQVMCLSKQSFTTSFKNVSLFKKKKFQLCLSKSSSWNLSSSFLSKDGA